MRFGGDLRGVGDVRKFDELVVEPLTVGLFRSDLLLDFVIGDDAAFFHVDQEHATRLQATLARNPFGRDGQDAGFRGHDDEVIFGHVIAGRTETVAVERGADHRAVGKDHGRGAIPRLHQAGIEFVESLLLFAHGFVAIPGLRNHHHHRLRQRAAAHDEKLEDVIKHRRVGTVGVHDRLDFGDILTEEGAGQQRLASLHPVNVAAQSVNFSVMGDVVVGVRAFPAGESVGREAGVDEGKRRIHRSIAEVREILADLFGHQHAFVDDRPAGETAGVVEVVLAGSAQTGVGLFADDE